MLFVLTEAENGAGRPAIEAVAPLSFSPSVSFCPLLMRWTAPTTGIAMRQDTVDVAERFESAYG